MEGRFVSKDPLSFAGGDVNLYAYTDSVGKPPVPQVNLYAYTDSVGKPLVPQTNLYQYTGIVGFCQPQKTCNSHIKIYK